jgi:hypothetical protein
LGTLGTAATNGLLCQPLVIMMEKNWWNDWQGKPKYSEKAYPSAALSTNPTCCPDANPGRRGGKPATNRLNYGSADPKITLKCTLTTPLFTLVRPPVSIFSQLLFRWGVLFRVSLN